MLALESLLEEWKTIENPDINSHHLATKIVEETENILAKNAENSLGKSFWFEWLNTTKKPVFLQALGTNANRMQWSELVFRIIQFINYPRWNKAHFHLELFKILGKRLISFFIIHFYAKSFTFLCYISYGY